MVGLELQYLNCLYCSDQVQLKLILSMKLKKNCKCRYKFFFFFFFCGEAKKNYYIINYNHKQTVKKEKKKNGKREKERDPKEILKTNMYL